MKKYLVLTPILALLIIAGCAKNNTTAKCTRPYASVQDSLACINSCGPPYASFSDSIICVYSKLAAVDSCSLFFTFTVDGNTKTTAGNYHYLGCPNHIGADGKIQFATLGYTPHTGTVPDDIFSLVCSNNSDGYSDSSSTGFGLFLSYTGALSVGTFTIDDIVSNNNTKSVIISYKTGTGPIDHMTNYITYGNDQNLTRVMSGGSCNETSQTVANQTLTITKWGGLGAIIEGTISGTLYENYHSGASCVNSVPHSYTAQFRLVRLS